MARHQNIFVVNFKLLDTNVDGVPDDYGDNRDTHNAILDIPAIP